ncbi:MAG: hypothetical protein C4539_11275 [Ignavibacteriales bacterium]|nr:MAG: hypothetical protein C4539_11275 [Ignavibacteriales bacterium]
MELKTIELIEAVEKFSNNKLKLKDDLERLIGIAITKNKFELLEKTAFTAKYLQGLFTIIQRGDAAIDEQVFNRYKKEYAENIEKIRTNLDELIKGSSDFYIKIFNEKFLSMTQVSISNLTDLCSDLAWLKMYLNRQ